jgi:catechol 2,3-dioxygenase-like lactoylglutathione lyase family enzyme
MSSTTSRIGAIHALMVPVKNQDAALDFYVGKLGWEKRSDVGFGEGDRWIEVAPPGGEAVISLVPPRGIERAAIAVTTDDVDGAHAAYKEQGLKVADEVMRMGGPVPPMFELDDPDGNVIWVVGTPES